jgi:tetratricopeptide (TPR) repeat protein
VARFRGALGGFGLDPESVAPEAAAEVARGSAVRERITAAWDWLLQAERTAGVRAALQAVDPDSYRDAVRDAVRGDEQRKIAELAGLPAALEQPAEFTAVFGENRAIGVERRRLLEAAAARRPGAVGLLMTLGNTYPWNRKEGSEERVRWFQAAVAADPSKAAAHNSLGAALWDRQDLAGAEAAFREALRLDSQYAPARNGLGNVLLDRKDLAGAEAAFREAIRLDPQVALTHNNLGNMLRDRKDLAGAEAAYRQAIRVDPLYAMAHGNLGLVLQLEGDLEGAITHYKEALRHDPKDPLALAQLPRAEQMRQLLPRLAEVLDGKAEPENPAQACALASLCAQPFQKRYTFAVRLYDRAFRADPLLAADLQAADRYYASTYAVLAAGGEGKDPPADAAARTALRQQGLGWLRADLVLRHKQAISGDAGLRDWAAWGLDYWLTDPDLAGVREPGRLAALPAAERADWEKLWAAVQATVAEARKPAAPAGKDAGKK